VESAARHTFGGIGLCVDSENCQHYGMNRQDLDTLVDETS